MNDQTPPTPEQLAEWRRLADDATPGPWEWHEGALRQRFVPHDTILWSANAIPSSNCPEDQTGACGEHAEKHAETNMAFIAAARTALPLLLGRTEQTVPDRLIPIPPFIDTLMVALPDEDHEQEFLEGLRDLLNRTSMDSQCGTPDFILAELVLGHLRAFRQARIAQAKYEGRETRELHA